MSAPENGAAFLGLQRSASGGSKIGPKLNASMFIPSGYGLVFIDSSGLFWRLALAQDASGNTIKDEGGTPQMQLVQIEIS